MKRILFFSLVCLFMLSNMVFSSWTCKSKPKPDTPVVPKVTYSGIVLQDMGDGIGRSYTFDNSWLVQVIEQSTGQYVTVSKGAYNSFLLQIEKGKAKALYVTGVQRGMGLNGTSTVLHSCRSAVYYLTQNEIQNGADGLNLLVTIK